MGGYGVPAEVEGALPWAWARERLVASRNYWVVTANAAGRPHALPVWGVWLPSEVFWFGCAPSARKARNLAANPHAVVTVDSTVEVVSVECRGRASTEAELAAALVAFEAKYGAEMAENAGEGDDAVDLEAFLRQNAAFTFEPERAFGIIERPDEFSARATRWRWT